MIRSVFSIVSLVTLSMCVSACGRNSADKPPAISYGRTPCSECRMIVSDEAYAAALTADGDDGPYTAYRFDDIGCMLHFMQSHSNTHVARVWVHDRMSLHWLDATTAHFVQSDQILTPMASGFEAFADAQHAADVAAKLHTQVLRWPMIVAQNSSRKDQAACDCCIHSE